MNVDSSVLKKAADLFAPMKSKIVECNVMLRYDDDKNAYLIASSAIGSVTVNLGVKADASSDIVVVLLDSLLDTVNAIASDVNLELSVAKRKKSLIIKDTASNTLYEMAGLDMSCFAESSFVETGKTIELPASEFSEALRFAIVTAESSKDKYTGVLAGIHISYKNGVCVVESTDRYRMSQYFLEAKANDENTKIDVTIPAEQAVILTKENIRRLDLLNRANQTNDNINIPSENIIRFQTDNNFARIIILTYDDKYPDLSSLVLHEPRINIQVNPKDLIALLNRVDAVSKNTPGNSVTVKISSDNIKIGAHDGYNRVYGTIEATSDNDITFAVNNRFLSRCLQYFSKYPIVNIGMNNEQSPVIIYIDKSKCYRAVMPMHIANEETVDTIFSD